MSAAAATTIYGRQSMPSARRVRRLKAAVAIGLSLLAAASVIAIRDDITRPTMSQVVQDTRTSGSLSGAEAAARTVDGLRFPDWSGLGWRPVGGSRHALTDGRTAATTEYTRGDDRVTFTIVSGTDNVDDNELWPTATFAMQNHRRVELLESTASLDGVTVPVLKRHVRARTVVLTGSSPRPSMVRELRRLALLDAPADQRVAN